MIGLYFNRPAGRGGPPALLMFLLGAVVALAGAGALYVFVLRAPAPPPAFTGNAVWLGVTWSNDPHTPEEIRLLGEHLSAHAVRDVYVYVSYLRVDTNKWNETYEYAREFVRILKEAAPGVRVLAWLGVPVHVEDGTYRLDSETIQAYIVQFAERAVTQFGFDGVQLNVETVFDGNADFPVLLDAVKEALGPDAVLSVTVPPDWNPGQPGVPVAEGVDEGLRWSADYKREVGARTDQIAVMAYNSLLESQTDYETWMAYQVEAYCAALADLPDAAELVIGVPTYADAPGHDEQVESLRAALNGVRDGLRRAGEAGKVVVGVGLYAFWDADAVEWGLYREMWLNAAAP
ncbi:MAG: hypothetical protein JXB47_07455 [Anaerolineae bacterium]|nr:hypothetical protein [Anaerolineae bacterium]